MQNVDSVTKEVIERLGNYLSTKMGNIIVTHEFPSANQQLILPQMTISDTGMADYEPVLNPYVLYQGALSSHKKDTQYVVGKYSFNLQIDLWCRNKEERNKYYQEFFKAINSQFPLNLGLSLNLTDYYNIVCRYNMTGFKKEDNEISSQTREWRVKINVTADCSAVLERSEYIMENLELHTEIPMETLETKNI